MTCISAVLGDTFKLEYMVPLRANAAPTIPADAPAAYTAGQLILNATDSTAPDMTVVYLNEAAPNRL